MSICSNKFLKYDTITTDIEENQITFSNRETRFGNQRKERKKETNKKISKNMERKMKNK